MTSNCRILAFAAIAPCVVAGLCISGCDDAAVLPLLKAGETR